MATILDLALHLAGFSKHALIQNKYYFHKPNMIDIIHLQKRTKIKLKPCK